MEFYHGSPINNINSLIPHLAYLGQTEALVYTTSSKVMATFYCLKNFEYTYGFNKDKQLVYTEYYEDSLQIIYQGKKGYLYECDNLVDYKEGKIPYTYTTNKNVNVKKIEEVDDLYLKLLEYEQQGVLVIERYNTLSDNFKKIIERQILEEIKSKQLLITNNDHANYIKEHYPDIWQKAENDLLK